MRTTEYILAENVIGTDLPKSKINVSFFKGIVHCQRCENCDVSQKLK